MSNAKTQTRRILLWSPKTGKKEFSTSVSTWGELKTLLDQENIAYSGMKVIVGETKNTIETDEAVLPAGDFTLYFMVKKSKAGKRKRGEINRDIKSLIERDGEKAKAHFNAGGNYTRKPSDELEELINSYQSIPSQTAEVASGPGNEEDIEVAKVREIARKLEEEGDFSHIGDNFDKKLSNLVEKLKSLCDEAQEEASRELDEEAEHLEEEYNQIKGLFKDVK